MSLQLDYLPTSARETFQIAIPTSPSPHPSPPFLSETAGKAWDVFFLNTRRYLVKKGEGRVISSGAATNPTAQKTNDVSK
jgi:hypothetical protein